MPNPKTTLNLPFLIAPCGINCRLCRAYIRPRQSCPGCRGENTFKSKSCIVCAIKNCEKRVSGELEYCFACAEFPCARLAHLDLRYRTRYATSPLDNLIRIRESGIEPFVASENEKWTCPQCGAMLSMHKPQCISCGYVWHEESV